MKTILFLILVFVFGNLMPVTTTARVMGKATMKVVHVVHVVPSPKVVAAYPSMANPHVDSEGVYHVNDGIYDTFTVCVPNLAVKNNPGDEFPALRYLHEGDTVTVYDRSKGVLGWAMIEPAIWVKESGLCR